MRVVNQALIVGLDFPETGPLVRLMPDHRGTT